MERYNYLENIKSDIRIYIGENFTEEEIRERLEDRENWEEELNDDLWVADNVTGNGSGSYYCNTWKAEEALCHNWDLLAEALTEFGCDINALDQGAEYCDVTVRCYLLNRAINETLDDLEEEEEE